jgi:hypothetical protein
VSASPQGYNVMSEGTCPGAIVEPPWIEALPRLSDRPPHASGRKWRGHGELLPCLPCAIPGGTQGDPVRNWALALRRRCSVCGCTMDGPFCNMTTTRQQTEWPGGVFTTWIPGPMHKSCALYSALVCPFFKYPTSRERRPQHHALRGDAAVLGFDGYGQAYFAEPTQWGVYHLFAYAELVERIPFGHSRRDLLALYDDAVAADAAGIDLGTRLYWGDSPADQQRLMECKEADDVYLLEKLRLEHPLAAARIDRSGSGPNG